ncbi:hypothetical protein KF840_11770 [bacterium]|nr:hypothetical protein [bacterium]
MSEEEPLPSIDSRREGAGTGSGRMGSMAWLAVALAFTAVAYWPILRSYFFIDDYFYLYLLRTESLPAFLFKPWFGHLFALRNAAFAGLFRVFDTDPTGYFVAVLLTHLVNVALLFRVLSLQTASRGLAFFGASLWGISPLHGETLAWLSVYGHCLVATLLLLVVAQVASIGAGDRPLPRAAPWLWSAALLGAALSYGVGVPLAMMGPLVIALMLPAGRLSGAARRPLVGVAIAVPLLWILANLLKAGPDPGGIGDWRAIVDVIGMRALLLQVTELVSGLVVAGLTQMWLPPAAALAGRGAMMALLAGAVALGLALMLARAPRDLRRVAAAWSLVTIAAYGIIAVGRSPMAAVFPPDQDLIFPRYHYVASLGITALFCLAGAAIGRRWAVPDALRRLAPFAWAAACAAMLWYLPRPIDLHVAERARVLARVGAMRAAIARQPAGGEVFLTDRRVRPGFAPSDWDSGTFIAYFDANTVEGRRVRFVADPERVRAARDGDTGRLAALLATADEAAGAGRQSP